MYIFDKPLLSSEWEEYYDQQTDQDLLETTESWLNSPHPISLSPLDDQTEHADAGDDQDLTTQLDSFEETTNEIWNDSPTSPLGTTQMCIVKVSVK